MDRFIIRALTPPLAVTSHTSLGVTPTMLSSPTYGRKRLIVSAEELAKHNTADDEWAAIHDKSVHMKPHGGGAEQLMRTKKRDGTIHFNDHEVHKAITADSESVLQKYVIGTLSLLPSAETTQRGIASIVQSLLKSGLTSWLVFTAAHDRVACFFIHLVTLMSLL